MNKLAIIGASHFQNPLILRAKEMGIETHVFAWQCGDVGEFTADYFYPISITDHEAVLNQCREIGVDGIVTIASDLANKTVAYVAEQLGLVANSVECVNKSTDKHLMRKAFAEGGDPSPKSIVVDTANHVEDLAMQFPVIVKPADRSGSRGITRLESISGLQDAIVCAISESFSKRAIVEEYMEGREFSVEFISWKGQHHFLALTEKFTTGDPHYIERGHLEPARVKPDELERIKRVVVRALDTLNIMYGASHSEVMLMSDGRIGLIEIGSRMGGDHIGSDLVELSTGYDFLEAVIDIALGRQPQTPTQVKNRAAAIRFVFDEGDLAVLNELKQKHPESIQYISPIEMPDQADHVVTDSSTRYGYYIYAFDSPGLISKYLPD